MKPGDVMVQRGTYHAWANRTVNFHHLFNKTHADPSLMQDKWARMYFILCAAKPVEHNGQKFEAAGYHKDEMST